MEKKLSFFGSAFYYTLGVILAQGVQFLLMTIIFGRVLNISTADYGYISIYYTWFAVFGTIVGLEAASSINNARIRFGEDKLNNYTSSLLGIGFITLAVFGVVLLAGQAFFVPALGFPLPVLMSCLLQGFFFFCSTLIAQKCRVTGKPVQFIVWTATACVLRLILSTTFISQMKVDQYLGDVLGSLISYGVMGIAAIIFLVKDGKSVGNKAFWAFCLTLTVPLVFHSLANLVLGLGDRIMLEKMMGVDQAGIYSFVYNIGVIANAVWLAFNNAWTVWYFDRTKEEDNAAINHLYKRYVGFFTFLTFAIMLIAPDLVMFFGGEKYAPGVPALPIIMLGCYFMFLYTFPVNYETYRHKTVFIALGTVMAAGINVGLNFFFIPKWGILGAALTTLVAYIALFLFHYIIARFLIKGFQIKFLHLLLPACATLGIVLLTYGIMDLFPLRWFLAAMALIVSYYVYKRSRDIMM